MAVNKIINRRSLMAPPNEKPTNKKKSKFVMNKLKLSKLKGNGEPFFISYIKKDGTPRVFKVNHIIDIKDTAVVVQTEDLEFKRLLIENIQEIEEKKEEKSGTVQQKQK